MEQQFRYQPQYNRNHNNNTEHKLQMPADDDEIDYEELDGLVDDEEEEGGPSSVLIRLIQSYDWAGTLARISSHPSECRSIGSQGRTPLHVACNQDAPAVVIQALLKSYPEASLLTGTTNMNPLHITCSSQHASVHVVRVLLEGGRFEQFSMRDLDGDTPLHAACRCGSHIDVLEVLLRAHPAAVHERDYEGLTPIQRLWVRYFVILGDDMIESVNCAADLSGELLDAWKKTELLLRCAHHGTLDVTKPGSPIRFRAVHATAAVDCPRAIVRIATKVYPHQLEERDEHGRTPLMVAASAPVYQVKDLSDEGYMLEDHIYGDEPNNDGHFLSRESSSTNMADYSESHVDNSGTTQPSVIEILLNANVGVPSQGACLPDPSGRLPLHLALATGKRWHEGVQALIEAYPDAVGIPDRSSKLFPFMLAGSGSKKNINATYELLRLNPSLVYDLTKKNRKQQQNTQSEHSFETPDKEFEATRL